MKRRFPVRVDEPRVSCAFAKHFAAGTMFSANLKQFRLKHLFVYLVAFAIAMGLLTSGQPALFHLGIAAVVAVSGTALAAGFMFVSDLIDDRPIDDRKWSSRFFNFIGLMLFVATFGIALLYGVFGIMYGVYIAFGRA